MNAGTEKGTSRNSLILVASKSSGTTYPPIRTCLPSSSVTTAGAPPVLGWSLRSDIHCLSFMVGGGGGSLPPAPAKGVAPDKKLFALMVCTAGAGGTSFPQARSIAGSLSVARLGVARIARQRAAARKTLVMSVLSIRFERSCRPPVRAGKPGEPEAGPQRNRDHNPGQDR